MQICFFLTFLLLIGVAAGGLRIYDNPLNNKAVDLFFLVDEHNSRLSPLQLGQIKITINDIVTELQPVGSSPYFGVFFYGATSAVDAVVPFPTTLATVVKSKLDLKQYTAAQPSPSTLSSAVASVDAPCYSYCRANTPRVTVIFTGSPDSLAEFSIRQLERLYGMTVIVVGIGSIAHTATLNILATYPSATYAVPFSSFTELIVSAPYLSSLISNVPRLLAVGSSLSITSTTSNVYYTVQLNTYGFISTNDTVVTYTTNCYDCSVYGSLSEPNPTSVNTAINTNRQYVYAPGYTYSIYYFRVPRNANRFFLSFTRTGTTSLTGVFNVFTMPPMMSFPTGVGPIPN